MDEPLEPRLRTRPRYVWPWFVLGAVVLGLVLAVLWMSQAVRHTREQRDLNGPYPVREAIPPGGNLQIRLSNWH